ncbi:MAG: metal ABC transporter ATP-binding protein [Desulfobacterales bacterium]|nr:metal ABC transporter ATP-binding protein [Desulfobacterales bacterium]
MSIIEAQAVSVRYGSIEALSQVSFTITEGDYVGIVGPNGSGKTTLIKALLGLTAYEGDILFQGKKLSEFIQTKHIGYLPQKLSFLDKRFPATVREIVVSGVYCCKKFPKYLTKEDHTAAESAMELLGIVPLADRLIGKLSGGQQQRVLLARALVHKPQLIILDEPTVALDPQSREAFYATLSDLHKTHGVTVLIISHEIGSVSTYASKLLYLDQRLIFYGSFEEFYTSKGMADNFKGEQHFIHHRQN